MRLLPPRGTITSTCFSSAIRWPTAARSVVATTCTAFSGRPASRSPWCTQAAIAVVAAQRLRAAAQDGGVAGLEAQPRGIRGHVRPRFVDDADHAERHAHAADLDAASAGSARSVISPTGSGSAAISVEAVRHRERRSPASSVQPVDERRIVTGGLRGRDVLGIGGEELAPRRGGSRPPSRSAHGSWRWCPRARRRARRRAQPRRRRACTRRRRRTSAKPGTLRLVIGDSSASRCTCRSVARGSSVCTPLVRCRPGSRRRRDARTSPTVTTPAIWLIVVSSAGGSSIVKPDTSRITLPLSVVKPMRHAGWPPRRTSSRAT